MLRDNEQDSPQGFFNPWLGGTGRYDESMASQAKNGAAVFMLDGGYVRNCAILFGRELVTCADTALDVLDPDDSDDMDGSIIYAKVTHNYESASLLSLSVHSGSSSGDLPANTLGATYRLLYMNAGGEWVDYRFTPSIVAGN